MNERNLTEGAEFERALIELLTIMGRLADSDDKRLTIDDMPHDMQNIRVHLSMGADMGVGNCVLYLLESNGAAIRLATQGEDPVDDFRSFGIAGDVVSNNLDAAVRALLPKLVMRAGRDTTRNMNVTLKMFKETT